LPIFALSVTQAAVMKSSMPSTLVAAGAALVLGPLLLTYRHTGGPPANLFTETGIGYEWICMAAGIISMMAGVGAYLKGSNEQ
jgi:hypothetical protein